MAMMAITTSNSIKVNADASDRIIWRTFGGAAFLCIQILSMVLILAPGSWRQAD
jgi:hypothetical protein